MLADVTARDHRAPDVAPPLPPPPPGGTIRLMREVRSTALSGGDGALEDAVHLLIERLGIDYARLDSAESGADAALVVERGRDAAQPPALTGSEASNAPADPAAGGAPSPLDIELWQTCSGGLPAALRERGLVCGARLPMRGGALTVGSRHACAMSELVLACCQAAAQSLEEAIARRRLASKLLRLRRRQVTGDLAATVVHDYNNVLTAVMSVTALFRERLPSGDDAHGYLEMIDSLSVSAAALGRQLLDFAGDRDDCARPVDLNELVRELCALARSITAEGVEVHLELGEPLPPVGAVRPLFQQALLNLVLNAAEAMPRGGHVLLRTRLVPGAAGDGDAVAIDVIDRGSGIAPEVLPFVFEPFFTTKHSGEGTGLGLASVQQTVRRHGGRVEVESTVGVGSTFTVLLPAWHD